MEKAEYTIMSSQEEVHWWWRARREILAEVIEQHAPNVAGGRMRIVEVGCGSGGNLPMLAKFGDVLGAEHERAALDCLHEKYGATYRVVQHSVPAPLPGAFHVLAMFDVLEHVEDDRGALRWVSGQLEPGGIAVITVPAWPFLWCEHDEALHHFRRYTRGALLAAVPPGIEVAHVSYFNALLFPPIAAVRSLLRLLPRRARPPRSQVDRTPAPFNWLFYQLFRLERLFVPRHRLPLGVSLLAVLRKPEG